MGPQQKPLVKAALLFATFALTKTMVRLSSHVPPPLVGTFAISYHYLVMVF
jgi:hypothetical protein